MWFTDDDIPEFYEENVIINESTARAYYKSPGLDNVWFSRDDKPDEYRLDQLTINNQTYYSVRFNAAGNDKAWFTADDIPYQYSLTANRGENIFNGSGADGIWFSDDDTLYRYSFTKNIDASVYSGSIVAAGLDNIWHTDDDIPNRITKYVSDNLTGKNLLQAVYYSKESLGVDGLFFTDDDIPSRYATTQYNNDQYVSDIMYYGSGLDGKWYTVDDQVFGYIKLLEFFTPGGALDKTFEVTYSDQWVSMGDDGIWLTEDDVPSMYVDNFYVRYNGPGQDGIWFNSDDDILQ